jgi:hypothetical protein
VVRISIYNTKRMENHIGQVGIMLNLSMMAHVAVNAI